MIKTLQHKTTHFGTRPTPHTHHTSPPVTPPAYGVMFPSVIPLCPAIAIEAMAMASVCLAMAALTPTHSRRMASRPRLRMSGKAAGRIWQLGIHTGAMFSKAEIAKVPYSRTRMQQF